MTVTLGGSSIFIVLALLCAVPLVLAAIFVLFKLRLFEAPRQVSGQTQGQASDTSPAESQVGPGSERQLSFVSRNRLPLTAGGFLLGGLACGLVVPFSFVFALAAGMGSASNHPTPGWIVFASLGGFVLNIAAAIAAGILGLILLFAWIGRRIAASRSR